MSKSALVPAGPAEAPAPEPAAVVAPGPVGPDGRMNARAAAGLNQRPILPGLGLGPSRTRVRSSRRDERAADGRVVVEARNVVPIPRLEKTS